MSGFAEEERLRKIEYCERELSSGRRTAKDCERIRETLKRLNHAPSVQVVSRPDAEEDDEEI